MDLMGSKEEGAEQAVEMAEAKAQQMKQIKEGLAAKAAKDKKKQPQDKIAAEAQQKKEKAAEEKEEAPQ